MVNGSRNMAYIFSLCTTICIGIILLSAIFYENSEDVSRNSNLKRLVVLFPSFTKTFFINAYQKCITWHLPFFYLLQTSSSEFVDTKKEQLAPFNIGKHRSAFTSVSKEVSKYLVNENVRIHRAPQKGADLSYLRHKIPLEIPKDLKVEAAASLRVAMDLRSKGKVSKAKKLLEHAQRLDPVNADILTTYGELIEDAAGSGDLIQAEHYYGRAIAADPAHKRALSNRRRTLPLVEEIDQRTFNELDNKVRLFYHIPDSHPGLRRAKREHYYRYVYHSNAIEGNTLSLAQTRSILETRLAVGGKSLIEQNEVLGLDSALQFLNSSLLRKTGPLLESDLLQIHRHVLGFVDLTEAGRYRESQVYVADYAPPPPEEVPSLMSDLMDWLNSEQAMDLHPIELAALAHWKLVFVHPFYDGNGRTARLLMNLLLMKAGYPPAIIRLEQRANYFELIKVANNGDVRPFIRFIALCTEQTLDEFLTCAKVPTPIPAGQQLESDEIQKPPRVIVL